MNYRHVLLIVEPGAEGASRAIAAIRRIAPGAEELIVLAHVLERRLPWLTAEEDHAPPALDRLRSSAATAARSVRLTIVPALDAGRLCDFAQASGIDLLALAQPTLEILSVAGELRKRLALPLLYSGPAAFGDHSIEQVVCMAFGSRSHRAVSAFLRDHGTPDLRLALVRGPILPEAAVDLVVLTRFPGPLLVARSWPAPVLVLPPLSAPAFALRRPIDVPDLVENTGVLRARFLFAGGIGRDDPIPDQEVAFVARGSVVAVAGTRDGDVEVSSPEGIDCLGVYRRSEENGADPATAIEQEVRVIRPGTRPLLLFDSNLAGDDLARLAMLRGPAAPDVLAIRMRPIRSCRAIRATLLRAGMAPAVADASAVLDEGAALDVAEELDAVRLARVADRMRDAGFPVAAIVHRDPHTPRTSGFQALRAAQLRADTPWAVDRPAFPRSLAARLDATTGTAPIGGNRIELELDNAKARRWLLDGIAGAQRRIHLQVYMAEDDDVGSRVESALAAAGARGVVVRVVVDSLHGLEGSFGIHNPLLDRLRARPGAELRVSRPITGVPSIEDVKQRDHRKLAIIDGTLALVGGRNLSHEYYFGFDEVELTPRSMWRQVPWLDGGAHVEGPAVAALERSFLDAWSEAGGAAFEIDTPPPAGSSSARVVVHHGLRDASTLDTYIALIDSATSHVNAVNGFPLILEIQHALLRAVRRGVRVRVLMGNLTPTHEGTLFEGPWGEARVAATELVHSRVDAVVAAGGEGYILAIPEQPRWERGLGTVYPHVHAKVITVDGRISSVGSANLDVTAAYWENELLLVVEDPAITRALEARIDELIGGSKRVDRDDPVWQQSARSRSWMRRWPGVLSI